MKIANRYTQNIPTIITFFILACILGVLLTMPTKLAKQNPETTNENTYTIPRIDITLNNTTLDIINSGAKETKYPGNQLTFTTNNKTSTYSGVEINLRGHLSLIQPKKPYGIKFSENVDLYGVGASKKWVLLANLLDDTYIRNDLAFYVQHILDEKSFLSGIFSELYIDNHYVGLYYLTPQIEIARNRTNLTNPQGIIVEQDIIHSAPNDKSCYKTITTSCFLIKDSVDKQFANTGMQQFITNYIQLELALENVDYQKITSLIDLDSFAKYYLLSEFTANPDAYSASLFFYTDGPDDVIHIGPGWDYDLAFSNPRWGWASNSNYYLPQTKMPQAIHAFNAENYDDIDNVIKQTSANTTTKLFYYLTRMPEFNKRVKYLYQEKLLGTKNELMDYAQKLIARHQDAFNKDSAKWPHDQNTETTKLLNWISQRYDYLETEYGGDY